MILRVFKALLGSSSSSNMATGWDQRSLDPLRGSPGCAQPEVAQHLL